MTDHVSSKIRSKIMSSVGTRDTGPELALRKSLHRLGWRYRTNVASLPGRPDLVFPALRKIVFVHGCFWHGHSCRWGKLPQSRPEYWQPKIAANRARDARVLRKLRRADWSVIVVWQCQLRQLDKSIARVSRFLGKKHAERGTK